VDSHDVRAVQNRDGDGRSRGIRCLAVRDVAEKRLAGRSDQNGVIQFRQPVQVRQNLRILLLALSETQAGIYHNPSLFHSGPPGPTGSRLQILRHGSHHIGQPRQLAPRLRSAAHVVENQPNIVLGSHLRQVGVEGQTTGVVENFDSILQRTLGNLRFIRVERQGDRQFFFEQFQNRQQPLPLFIR
jgi:hypothetical protein